MKTEKKNFRSRIKELCDRLNPRERKAVVLGMLLIIFCGCLAIFLRGVDRLIERSDTPKREITLDSLGHLAPPDSLWLNSFTLDNDGNE